MKTIRYESLSHLETVAREIVKFSEDFTIWVFTGQMGAGKTTLIKSIAKLYKIGDVVSSPSFSIVNEYLSEDDEKFYHFDFYRIDDPIEVVEIGIEEYFYSGKMCWIEWAEKIPEYIPEDFVLIKLTVLANGTREIHLSKVINGEING